MAEPTQTGPIEATPQLRSDLLGDPAHDGRDARLIASAIRRRWPIPDRLKALLIEKAEACLEVADNTRDVAALGKLLTAAESQNQADEHLADKNSRIDSGKATEAHVVVNLEFDNNG